MGRLATAVVAGVLAVAPLWAEDSDWRTPNSKPVSAPVSPAAPAPAPVIPPSSSAEHPAWNSKSNDNTVWNSAPVVPAAMQPLPQPKPAPVVPPVTIPEIPAKPSEQIPAPRLLPSKIPSKTEENANPVPPVTKLPEPRPVERQPKEVPPTKQPKELPPGKVWGAGPGEEGVVLEPLPGTVYPTGSVPMRHKTFGSPNLSLSRDHHFLDFFGLGLVGDESDTLIIGEGEVADRYFVQGEYLLWWVNPMNIPPLATSGRGGSFGYLGQPGTEVLLGPGEFGSSARSGLRVRAGAWLDCQGNGIDGSYFFLDRKQSSFQVDSTQFPTITRPFFAPNFNAEFGELVSYPGLATGALRVDMDSYLWGADVNLRTCLCKTCMSRSEWFAGYRHLNLQESLTMTEFIIAGSGAPDPAGTQIVVQDAFRVRNQFHGGQLGLSVGRTRGRWDLDTRLSAAIGVNHQELEITGSQQRTRPGQAPASFKGGLLAAGPNLGKFDNDEFSVLPEGTINLGYMVTPTLRAYVGYNVMYWSNVIRPGDQIDRVVDLTFVPNSPPVAASGQKRPAPLFHQTDFWTHGVQLGLEYRW